MTINKKHPACAQWVTGTREPSTNSENDSKTDSPVHCLEDKSKVSGGGKNGPTIIFKLLKPENTDAVTMKKSANTEQKKKLLYVCRTLAKPCCCMGSFLEGIFGINLIYDGLLKLTLMCVCARASMCACVRVNRLLKMLKRQKNTSWCESVWGEKKNQLLTKTVYTTLNLIFCKIKHNND